ncbi:hypothetical protein PHYPSEUDO_014664 [Phytophthora pseudosyringae]|uniref:Uncharacterized protein n=1 Tax=Phytophthora pseudosyringae TaxID=221518 RepID=A0A8T1W4Z9_9STRA|nr:hypothetical protein PHYPSEUDO_014664 [Phytophthora pseudosyringae]
MLAEAKTLRFVLVSPPLHERPQIAALENFINSPLISDKNAVVVYTKCSKEFDARSTVGLNIAQSKRNIRSFALREPKSLDPENHDYSLEYRDQKSEILGRLLGCIHRKSFQRRPPRLCSTLKGQIP